MADAEPGAPDYIGVNRGFYDSAADDYEERGRAGEEGADSPDYLAALLAERLPRPLPASRVLEVGPGPGFVLRALADSGAQCVAVELSRAMAELCVQRVPEATMHIGDILEFDFGTESFDGVMVNAVVHLFPYADALLLLARLRSWLTEGGVIVVTTTNHETVREGYMTKAGRPMDQRRFRRQWTRETLEEAVRHSGFEIIARHSRDQTAFGKHWVGVIGRAVAS